MLLRGKVNLGSVTCSEMCLQNKKLSFLVQKLKIFRFFRECFRDTILFESDSAQKFQNM